MRNYHLHPLRHAASLLIFICLSSGIWAGEFERIDRRIDFSGAYSEVIELNAGETVEISAGIESPSQLPANGRIAFEFTAPVDEGSFRKVLHALDPDVYVLYRAAQSGQYTISLRAVEEGEPLFNRPRWRETGVVSELSSFPSYTPWPAGCRVSARLAARAVELGRSTRGLIAETEPNNSIPQAQPLPLATTNDEQILSITGGADDIEYFDNGMYGESGDDWFRLEYLGSQPRLLSVNMMPTDPLVAARVRCYSADGEEYLEGKHLNETTHEQVEEHRTAIVRTVQPGGVYFLRVEANSPGYDLEIRIRRPAPFTDVRDAVRLAMYDHVAQVSAWLMNRPRGNSLDRRLRDTGSMYGTNCMSCHTQSGVWGPAVPLEFGYGIENSLHYRHLINVMYESLRPTNVLQDAANNTSLPPNDLGDGPAGTRVAGHNVLAAESVIAPRKLHSMQQIRTANYVLQTGDPSGINAAGKGSNVGQAVVIHYAGEILRRAWDKSREDRYLQGIEKRARAMLDVTPKFTDDIAHRILFFRRVFPADYTTLKEHSAEAEQLIVQISQQLERDETALRGSQRDDGAWGFTPGRIDTEPDPAPTALAIDALVALGADRTDPAVERGAGALLAMQKPYGLWNRSARTGFVTTAYVMNALARVFPDQQRPLTRAEVEPRAGETLHDTIARMRLLAYLEPWSARSTAGSPEEFLDLMLAGAIHSSPHVRYWAMIALGARHREEAVPSLIQGLGDSVKMVREAARWGLRQTLLDDHGWLQVLEAYETGSDLQREQLAAALVMRADAARSAASVDFARLAEMLDRMMSHDSSPAVRAWAARAAWNWWLWNPPIRHRLNQAYVTMLQTPEPSVLAENAKRYQLQALLIVNGNRASANYDNPYTELSDLFQAIEKRLDADAVPSLISQRLTNVAATYYNASYGANGTGQLGYATPHASETIGKAVVDYWTRAEAKDDAKAIRLAIEASANVIDEEVQQKLLHYSIKGPEALRPIAASSLSDPRAVLLPTTPEFVGPLLERIYDNARTEEGRRQITRGTVRQLSRARWDMSPSEGRQREFFGMMIPKLDDPSSEVQWFLADKLGTILATNPDFRTETLLAMVPKSFSNPLEELFWLPSMGWLITYDAPLPEVGESAFPTNRQELRQFALDVYLKCLAPDADRRVRERAVAMLYQPALYSNPQVVQAATKIDIGNLRTQMPETFAAEIRQAVANDMAQPKLELTSDRIRNLAFFRDFVIPELSLVNRRDGNSCFSCHGGGKVPSMSLAAPNRRTNYLSPSDLWTNYRVLLERVNVDDVESSKLLRKPLNIQSGQEDGHQGDMRYKPGDRGHEILKRWAYDVARLNGS
jgi:hypothetical protein